MPQEIATQGISVLSAKSFSACNRKFPVCAVKTCVDMLPPLQGWDSIQSTFLWPQEDSICTG